MAFLTCIDDVFKEMKIFADNILVVQEALWQE